MSSAEGTDAGSAIELLWPAAADDDPVGQFVRGQIVAIAGRLPRGGAVGRPDAQPCQHRLHILGRGKLAVMLEQNGGVGVAELERGLGGV